MNQELINILPKSPCDPGSVQCKKSSTLYTVIDNTGTSFAWTAEIELEFTDGSTTVILQDPNDYDGVGSLWFQQLKRWVELFSEALSQKCGSFSSEVRFNPRPFTLSDFTGLTAPDGLLFPPSEIAGSIPEMAYRYVQINACPTCVAIKRAKVISVNGNPFERDLVVAFKPGIEFRYDLCQDCGKEGTLYYQGTDEEVLEADLPVCLFDCGEQIPSPPEAGCNFTLVEACDQGVIDPITGDPKPIFIQYADCGSGSLVDVIYELDADGGLVEYTPVGPVDDCNGNPPDVPEPEIQTEDLEKVEICIDNGDGTFTSGWQVTRVDSDSNEFVTYEDATGVITTPGSFTIGGCTAECTECGEEVVREFITIGFNPPDSFPNGTTITYNGVTINVPDGQLFDESPDNPNGVPGSIPWIQFLNDNFPGSNAAFVPTSGQDSTWMCGVWEINAPGLGVISSQSILDVDPDFPDAICVSGIGKSLNTIGCNDDRRDDLLQDIVDGLTTEDCNTECEVGGTGGYDLTDTNFICSKVGFTMDNAFTSVCPDGWTPQDLVDALNAGNPNGAVFAVQSGNIIEVVSGTPPEFIQFFHSGGGTTTVYANGGGGDPVCAKRVKDCNSDRQTELLQEIADNTCPSTVSSNVVCASTAQTVALENGGTTSLTAGQELLVGEVYDCRANLQSFNISVLIAGQLEEIADPVDTGTCPVTPETIPTGCIKDENGQEWDSFQTTLNGTTITYYQDSITGVTGTPAGDPSDWSECGSETVISIPTTTVFDSEEYLSGGLQGHSVNTNYEQDIEALPVAFPIDYVPPVYIQNKTTVNYNQGNGNTGQSEVGVKVWFPESAVVPVEGTTEIDLPTITIVDFEANNVDNQDENVQDLIDAGYTKDIEALPIGVIAGDYLPVKIGLSEQEYYQGNGNNSSTTALRVALPESAVLRTETEISLPTITVQTNPTSYPGDLEAMPIAFEEGYIPSVFIEAEDNEYYAGKDAAGNDILNQGYSTRVSLNTSAVVKTETQVEEKTVNFVNGTQTGTLNIPTGAFNVRIIVRAGEVTINGATYDSCTPFVAEPLSHGGCQFTYPAISVVPSGTAEFTYSYTTL